MSEINLRTLNATDIAPMTSILTKIGVKQFKDCVPKTKSKDAEQLGITIGLNIAGVVLENYSKCQEDIFIFFASLTGKSEKEISKLSLADFAKLVISFFKKEEFKDFCEVASEFL